MRRFLKWFGAFLLLLFAALWVASGYVGTNIVTATTHRKIKPRNEIAGKPVEQVSITTEDGLVLSAWYVPNGSENAVITLGDHRRPRPVAFHRGDLHQLGVFGATARSPRHG
jgi:hypothetical protein